MSSSNWLDRLWSSKRFSSTSPHLVLHPSISSSLPHLDLHPSIPSSNPFTRITHSLSDLFCVGHPTIPNPPSSSSTFPTAPKFPRKQPNPMHYVVTKSSDSDVDTASDCADRIATGNTGLNDEQVKLVEKFNGAQEEEDPSLDGFSRTEVTVIDTSFAGWKFEKFLFRKDATWKARDNKGNKPAVALRKKIKNKEKKRKSIVMPTEYFEHKRLKVLYQGSSMIKTGSSACNEV